MCANAFFSFQISVSKLPWRFFREFENTKEHWLCASLYKKLAQNVCPWEWSHNTYMEKCEAFRKHKSVTLWRAGELKLLKDTRMEKKSGSRGSNMRSQNLAPYPSWKNLLLSEKFLVRQCMIEDRSDLQNLWDSIDVDENVRPLGYEKVARLRKNYVGKIDVERTVDPLI